MSPFGTATARQTGIALALLRAVLGIIFVAHGGQKLFVFGVDGVAAGFAQMGVPMAGATAMIVSLIEFLGGLAILAGLGTRIAAGLVVFVMAGAIAFAHLPQGFFNPGGVEFPLMLMTAALTLVVAGSGAFSLDAQIARRRADAPGSLSGSRQHSAA